MLQPVADALAVMTGDMCSSGYTRDRCGTATTTMPLLLRAVNRVDGLTLEHSRAGWPKRSAGHATAEARLDRSVRCRALTQLVGRDRLEWETRSRRGCAVGDPENGRC